MLRHQKKWRQIHENAEKYIYNILSEVPYSGDIIEVISKQLKNDLHIRSVFSDKVIISEERKKIFEEKDFQKYVKSGNLERKMKKMLQQQLQLQIRNLRYFFQIQRGQQI